MLRQLIEKLRGSKFRSTDSAEVNWAPVFAQARAVLSNGVAGDPTRNQVAIIRSSGDIFLLSAPPPGSASEAQADNARRLLPPEPRRMVAVIANTRVSGSVADVNKRIPFVGILTGLAYIGHRVIVFDGQLSKIEQGCRDADVLIY